VKDPARTTGSANNRFLVIPTPRLTSSRRHRHYRQTRQQPLTNWHTRIGGQIAEHLARAQLSPRLVPRWKTDA